VLFVSLTDGSRSCVESFVETFSIPWPCGYEATMETLDRFGAYSTEPIAQGFNVLPTLYLIGPHGRVVWHDAQARPHHMMKDAASWLGDLDSEIQHYLATEADAE
jgi:hypothetical protein